MPLRLPPLASLRLFEAAGRHLSFKRAAEELNVTPSAVSHGIGALERSLGVPLFLREPRRLTLTPAGADYLAYISEALSLIAVGTDTLLVNQARRVIALGRRPLVDLDLDSGALVEIGETMLADTAYWLVGSEGAGRRPDLTAFKRWLLKEVDPAWV